MKNRKDDEKMGLPMKNRKAVEERESRQRTEMLDSWRKRKPTKSGRADEKRESWWRTGKSMIDEEREADGDVRLLCNMAGKIVILPLEKYIEARK